MVAFYDIKNVSGLEYEIIIPETGMKFDFPAGDTIRSLRSDKMVFLQNYIDLGLFTAIPSDGVANPDWSAEGF